LSRLGRALVLFALVTTTIGCDRVTKHAAATYLEGRPAQSFFADIVRLEYAENAGGFLSLGATLSPTLRAIIFSVGTLVILILTPIIAIRLRVSGVPLMGITLMVAGGASNLADRLMRGSVIDFLSIGVGPLRTGIFNIADVAILIGGCVLLFRGGDADRK
jgi:signal peptidase II